MRKLKIIFFINIFLFGIFGVLSCASAASVSTVGTFFDEKIDSKEMFVAKNFAFITAPDGTTRLINVSDGAAPKEEWLLAPDLYYYPKRTKDIFINNDYAYITTNSGMTITDVSDPLSPKRLTAFYGQDMESEMVYDYRRFIVSDNLAYGIYDAHENGSVITKLHIFDLNLSNPLYKTPQRRLIGRYALSGRVSDFFVSDKTVYLIDNDSNLYVINASNPSSPSLMAKYAGLKNAEKIIISEKRAYIVSRRSEDNFLILNILDVSQGNNPLFVSSYNLFDLYHTSDAQFSSEEIPDIFVKDNYLFLAVNFKTTNNNYNNENSRLFVLDIFDSAAIVKEAEIKESLQIFDLFVQNNLIYLVYKNGGLRIFNFSTTSGQGNNDNERTKNSASSESCQYLSEYAPDPSFVKAVQGSIMLQVENNGEAWYVDPSEQKRYCLGRPNDAFSVMRKKGSGITNTDLSKIPTDTDSFIGDMNLRKRLSGKILLQVENKGEAWYVNPKNLKRYYLGRPADAFQIMKKLGRGITNANLAKIPTASNNNNSASANGLSYTRKTVKTKKGDFEADILIADLANPRVKILTDSASPYDCYDNCPVKSLKDYVVGNAAIAGINGTYFCPKDYSQCANSDGFYYYQIYNSGRKVLINALSVKSAKEPMIVFNNENKWVFYKDTREFPGISIFEFRHNTKIQSAISSGPLLIYKSANVLDESSLDNKQRAVKSARGGLGIKGTKVYMIIARGATVIDLGAIMESLNMEYAINLDGGGSSAMYYNGQYKLGPGRNIPNAIVVAER